MSTTNNNYARALIIHQKIRSGHRFDCPALAAELEISVRQASREIEYLRDQLGAPIEFSNRLRSYVYAEPAFELPSKIMAEGEAIAILIAHQALLQRQGTPLGRRLGSAVSKLSKLLPSEIQVNFDELMQSISYVPGPGRFVSETVLEALTEATTRHVTVTMSYYAASTDEHTVRDFDVYQLTHRQNDWYAVGYCHLRQALRTFAVSRIRDVIKTSKHYTIPADFDGEAYFKTAFGVEITDTPAEEVHLHFDKGSSRWVKERHWHATQRLVPQEDGSLFLYIAAGNTYELRQWILSFGARVEVIAPHSLRTAIIDEIRAAARRYEEAPAG